MAGRPACASHPAHGQPATPRTSRVATFLPMYSTHVSDVLTPRATLHTPRATLHTPKASPDTLSGSTHALSATMDTHSATPVMLVPQAHVCGGSTRGSSGFCCWSGSAPSLAVVGNEGLTALSLGYGRKEGGIERQHLAEVRASWCCCKRRQHPEHAA